MMMQFPKLFRLSVCAVSSVVKRAVSVWSVCSAVNIAGPNTAGAQAHAMPHDQKLGTISFPNSGNAAAQAPFIRGVKLYYSFEYSDAAAAFRDAAARMTRRLRSRTGARP